MPLYQFSGFELDSENKTLAFSGKRRDVQSRVMAVLIYLLENRDRPVPREELFDQIWAGRIVTDNALSFVLSQLRKTLMEKRLKKQFIVSKYRFGVQFVGEVEESARPLTKVSNSPQALESSPQALESSIQIKHSNPTIKKQHKWLFIAGSILLLLVVFIVNINHQNLSKLNVW